MLLDLPIGYWKPNKVAMFILELVQIMQGINLLRYPFYHLIDS